MSVAKVTEIIASSKVSFDDAVKQGVARASKTIDNIQSVWVKDMKAEVRNGEITEYRTGLLVTFVLK